MGLLNYSTQVKNKSVISVKDWPYLAKGDGVSDDSAPIQAALNKLAAPGDTNMTIEFPAGIYLINTPLILDFNAASYGNKAIMGYGATLQSGLQVAAPMLKINSSVICRYFTVEGLRFNGGAEGYYFSHTKETDLLQISGATSGMDLEDIYMSRWVNLTFDNTIGNCMRVTNMIFEITIDKCHFTNASNDKYCLFFDGTQPSSFNLTHCVMRGGRNNMRCSAWAWEVYMYGNSFFVAEEEGVVMEFAPSICIINNHFEANWKSATSVATAGGGIRFIGGGSFIGNFGNGNSSAGYYQKYVLDLYAAAGKTITVIGGEYTGDIEKYAKVTAYEAGSQITLMGVQNWEEVYGSTITTIGYGRTKSPLYNLAYNYVSGTATTLAPNLKMGSFILIQNLANNITINPTVGTTPLVGDLLVFYIGFAATGNWKITWDSQYKVENWQPRPDPFTNSTLLLVWDSYNWVPIGGNRPPNQHVYLTTVSFPTIAEGAAAGVTVTLPPNTCNLNDVVNWNWSTTDPIYEFNVIKSSHVVSNDIVRLVVLNMAGPGSSFTLTSLPVQIVITRGR